MASTARGARASQESRLGIDALASIMAQVLELDTISAQQTPAIYRLLAKSLITGISSTMLQTIRAVSSLKTSKR